MRSILDVAFSFMRRETKEENKPIKESGHETLLSTYQDWTVQNQILTIKVVILKARVIIFLVTFSQSFSGIFSGRTRFKHCKLKEINQWGSNGYLVTSEAQWTFSISEGASLHPMLNNLGASQGQQENKSSHLSPQGLFPVSKQTC